MSIKQNRHINQYQQKCNALSLQPTAHWLYVSIKEQRLYHYQVETLLKSYAVSTSKKDPNCEQDSNGTPMGLHRIAQKIGADAPPGLIFKGRRSTGQSYQELDTEARRNNYVTTRILWLYGMEDGVNAGEGCDSYQRYIYIHGTNLEENIGTPQSHGCVLLTNQDIIDLYDHVPEAALVYLAEK